MKIFHVEIQGARPMLMHAMGPVIDQTTSSSRKPKLTPEKAAEQAAYRDEEGFLVVPALNIMGMLAGKRGSARSVKLPRGTGFSASEVIKGSVRIEPDKPRLLDAKSKPFKIYAIDSQWVVNPSTGGKMVCHRARIDLPWSLKFDLKWNELIYSANPDVIKDTINKSANIGLCDYRPMYGLFEIKKIEVEDL